MKFWMILGCLAALLGSPIVAQTVHVKAAEHDGFTRVVFHMPTNRTAEFAITARGAELQFDRKIILDTQGLFSRLYADRVGAVRLETGAQMVRLAKNCDCDIKTFAEGQDMIIFDISDAAPDTANPLPDPVADAGDAGQTAATSTLPNLPLLPAQKSTPAFDLGGAHLQISAALQRAADRNILTPNRAHKPATDTTQAAAISSPVVTEFTGLQIDKNQAMTQNGSACVENPDLEFSQWRAHDDFTTALAKLRQDLISETGRVNTQTAIDLVRLYLSFGLGVEAMEILNTYDLTHPEQQLHHDLALIFMGKIEPNNMFASSASCGSHAAIWGILAGHDLAGQRLDTAAIQLAINALPREIRDYFGPKIIEKLVDADFIDLAENLSLQIKQRSDQITPDLELAHSEILADQGQVQEATATLENLAQNFTTISPKALIALIDLKAKQNQPAPPKLALVAEALAWENADTELAPKLQQTDAIAHLLAADFDRAVQKFFTAPMDQNFASQFLDLAVESLPAEQFLKTTIAPPVAVKSKITQSVSLKIAQRLIDYGLHDAATQYFSQRPLGDIRNAQAVLQARILADRQDYDQAAALLRDLDSPQSLSLRAKIAGLSQDWDTATTLADTQDSQALLNATALAKTTVIKPEVSQPIQSLINAVQSAPAPETDAVLGNTQTQIETSRALRQSLGGILENLAAGSDAS